MLISSASVLHAESLSIGPEAFTQVDVDNPLPQPLYNPETGTFRAGITAIRRNTPIP